MSSVLKALTKYSEKDMKERGPKVKRAPRKRPEKEVEKECMLLMRSWRWDMQIYEAKATFNPRTGFYQNQSMKAGTLDSAGSMEDGHSAYVEFKAKGCLRSFNRAANYRQKQFAIKKIQQNAFVAVVDTAELLGTIYTGWLSLRHDKEAAKLFLMKMLP